MLLPVNQLFATLIADCSIFNAGLAIGWLSPALRQFKEANLPVGEVTVEDSAWLASIFTLGGLVSIPIMLCIAMKFGKRVCIIISMILFIINSITIIVAENVNVLLIGRFIMGMAAITTMSNTPSYVGEIAQPKYRGTLASFFVLNYTSGITAGYLIGGFISYKAVAWFGIGLGVINLVLSYFMPETPQFLLECGRRKDAADVLAWLRRADPQDTDIQTELDDLATMQSTTIVEAAKQLLHSKPLRNGFLIATTMISIQGLCGMIAVHSYAVTIFAEGRTSIGNETSAVIYGMIQVLGAISISWLIERSGRKILMIISTLGMAFFMFTMGVYFHLKNFMDIDDFRWIPIVALSLCVYSYGIGVGGVPFILLSDLIINEVRTIATILAVQVLFLEGFIILRLFAPISAAYGIHVLFYTYGIVSLFGTLATLLLLTETKGKTSQEILDTNYRFKHSFDLPKI